MISINFKSINNKTITTATISILHRTVKTIQQKLTPDFTYYITLDSVWFRFVLIYAIFGFASTSLYCGCISAIWREEQFMGRGARVGEKYACHDKRGKKTTSSTFLALFFYLNQQPNDVHRNGTASLIDFSDSLLFAIYSIEILNIGNEREKKRTSNPIQLSG